MELEQLRMFITAAETGGFSAAGRSLYTSHSTVSRAVSALEKELGVKLSAVLIGCCPSPRQVNCC